jgi:hypothetical protein
MLSSLPWLIYIIPVAARLQQEHESNSHHLHREQQKRMEVFQTSISTLCMVNTLGVRRAWLRRDREAKCAKASLAHLVQMLSPRQQLVVPSVSSSPYSPWPYSVYPNLNLRLYNPPSYCTARMCFEHVQYFVSLSPHQAEKDQSKVVYTYIRMQKKTHTLANA